MATPGSRFRVRRYGMTVAVCIFLTVAAFAGRTPESDGPPALPGLFELEPLPVLGGTSPPADAIGEESTAVAFRESLVVRNAEVEIPKVLDDPGSLTGFRDRVGETLYIRVTGDPNAGSVYGSGVYTDDSTLAAAAVHAGVLDAGETGIVKVTILPGQANYDPATRHSIQSRAWGSWVGSYRVEAAAPSGATPVPAIDGEILDDPGNMTVFHRSVDATLLLRVTGSTDGFVWGTDAYTSDSDISTAAVHAGVLQPGETGVVRVTVQPVQFSFPGTNRNGVTSRDWLPWDGNYRIERVDVNEAR